MDKRNAIKISKQFSKEIKNFFPIEKVVLFGSYAKGTYHKWSDIDIAIVVNKPKFDIWEAYIKLGKIIVELDSRIEPHIIDRSKDYPRFLDAVYKEGIVVYSA